MHVFFIWAAIVGLLIGMIAGIATLLRAYGTGWGTTATVCLLAAYPCLLVCLLAGEHLANHLRRRADARKR